jgi:hypothetical protein
VYNEMDYRRIRSAIIRKRLRTLLLFSALACSALVMACTNDAGREEANGESDGIKMDWVAAVPQFEQAYAAHPDVTNQFNLATAYDNTGQYAKAKPLYEAVVINGKFTLMDTGTIGQWHQTDEARAPGSQRSDLSAEASRRLNTMASDKILHDRLKLLARHEASAADSHAEHVGD